MFGPVYEVLLAATGLFVHDLFTAARVLSALAAGATMLAWWAIARRGLGAAAALAMVALLAVNPTFARYGYSANTDATSLALFSLSAWATFAARGPRRLALAGALAALATLTRYNLATLLPAGVLLLSLAPGRPRARATAVAAYLGGALAVLVPWTLASLAAGYVPGLTLLRDRGYYGAADPAQVLENRYRDITAGIGAPLPASEAGPRPPLLELLGRGLVEHLGRDATELLGLPVAALALAGLVTAFARRRLRAYAPWAPLAAFTFLPLVPVYYSLRYSMVLLPLYALPAAGLVAEAARAPWPRPARIAAAWALALAVLVPTARGALASHAAWRAELPLEARAAGEAIRAHVRPGERLLARKAHTAYYAGLDPVPFPIVDSLPALAAFCRAHGVRYLYYSGVEARSRPLFGYLLDTSATVPGLAAVYASERPPSVVYRIGPSFGAAPAWWPDDSARQRVAAHLDALMLPDGEARACYLALARDELRRGRPAEALHDAEAATRIAARPDAGRLCAEALVGLGDRAAAIDTLRAVLARAPDDADTELRLGLLLSDANRNLEAARVLRPLVGRTRDPGVLRSMYRHFVHVGDLRTARRVRLALDALEATSRARDRG